MNNKRLTPSEKTSAYNTFSRRGLIKICNDYDKENGNKLVMDLLRFLSLSRRLRLLVRYLPWLMKLVIWSGVNGRLKLSKLQAF